MQLLLSTGLYSYIKNTSLKSYKNNSKSTLKYFFFLCPADCNVWDVKSKVKSFVANIQLKCRVKYDRLSFIPILNIMETFEERNIYIYEYKEII